MRITTATKKQLEEFELVTKKFFYEQKAKEIGIVAVFLAAVCLVAKLIDYILINPEIIDKIMRAFVVGILVIALLIAAAIIVYLVFFTINYLLDIWINSNWRKAEHRAAHYCGIEHEHATR